MDVFSSENLPNYFSELTICDEGNLLPLGGHTHNNCQFVSDKNRFYFSLNMLLHSCYSYIFKQVHSTPNKYQVCLHLTTNTKPPWIYIYHA